MSAHNLCFEQKYEKYQNLLSENFHFLVVKFSVYLNRHVFIMIYSHPLYTNTQYNDKMCLIDNLTGTNLLLER